MNIFGYNLSNNGRISFIRDNYMKATASGRCNLYFAYNSRNGTPWGNSVLLYANSTIASPDGGLQDPSNLIGSPDDADYFISLFGEDSTGNLFKVIKSGKYNFESEVSAEWKSNFLTINKYSTVFAGRSSISFETLLSKQNSANISKEFTLWRNDSNDGLVKVNSLYPNGNFVLDELSNIDNSLYDSPTTSRLVATGNTESFQWLQNLKFVRNINDGSYSKCYNLSPTMISNIQTGNIVMSDTIFDLVSDDGIIMVTGLSYKSLVKISDVDYALIFEYATSTGAKNLTVTTENFDLLTSDISKLGIFVDSNYTETNTNANRISPIDSALVTNSVFGDSLNFNYTTPPTTPTTGLFFKYLLSDEFIDHNKILTSNVYWITQKKMPSSSNYTPITINGVVYYRKAYDSAVGIPEYYNIDNLLIEVDLANDFKFNDTLKYDMFRNTSGNYQIRNGSGFSQLNNTDFSLREIVIYYKNASGKFVPIYYARMNISINNNGDYKFQIII